MELVANTEPGRRFAAVAEAHAEAFRERASGHDAAGSFPAENFEDLKKSGGIAAFVLIAWLVGDTNPELRRVVAVDWVASAALVAAVLLDRFAASGGLAA